MASQQLTSRRAELALEQGIVESVARVTSVNNVWADLGSRGDIELVCRQAVTLGLRPCRVAVPRSWRDTTGMLAAAAAERDATCS